MSDLVWTKDTLKEVMIMMISQSWCWIFLIPVLLITTGHPLADSDAQLLGPTLLRRSSALTDSVLGVDPLNPLLDPLSRSLDTLALASGRVTPSQGSILI